MHWNDQAESIIFNPYPSSNKWSGATSHLQVKKEIPELCCWQEKLWKQSLRMREMLLLSTLNQYLHTHWEVSMPVFVEFVVQEKWLKCAPIWQQTTHKCAYHRWLHIIWVDSVATPILKSWPCTIGFLPVWSSENLSARAPSHIAWGTSECHSVIAADKGDNFYWAGIHALFGRWKRTVLTGM